MKHNLAELRKEFQALKSDFSQFQKKLFEEANFLGVLPEQKSNKIASISELESLLETVEKAEEKQRSSATKIREQGLAVLEKILAICHQNNSNFQPLLECQQKARELKQQMSESAGVQADSEMQALAEGSHSFSQLLGLISEGGSQDYQRLAQLQAAVTQSFRPDLAMAAVRGHLVFSEEAKGEVNYSEESASQDEHFVKKHLPEESEVASVEKAIARPIIEDFQEQPAVESIPDEEPLEMATPLPVTEAPEETEKEQPVWNFSPYDKAEAIAQSIKNYTKQDRPAALCHLIWRLLREEQFSFAYHLARALEHQEPKPETHLPSWLIRALALSQHLRSNTDPIANSLKDDFANYTDLPGEDEWNYAVMLLLAAASLRPALLAPNTGAYSILQQLPLSKAKLNRLYEYCQVISEYGYRQQHSPLEPKILKKATSPAERQESLERLKQRLEDWWFKAQTLDMKHGVASKVWENWLKANGLVNSLLNPIRTEDSSALATIRQQVTQLSDESNLKEAARRTEGQVRTRRRGNPIPEKVVNRLCKFATQAVDLAREWADLQQEELEASQKSYIQQQAEQLGKEISAVQDEAIAELNNYEKQEHRLFVLVGVSCCRKALEDIRGLFNPDKPLPTGRRRLEYIIHAPLLKIPSLPMNEEWEPDVSDAEQILDGIVETVASGDRSWGQAFEARCQQRDHEATGRLIEYLRDNFSEPINIEQLEEERKRGIDESQTCLLGEIKKTSTKVEEAVAFGCLGEKERLDYVGKIEAIENEAIEDENEMEKTLRFSEKLEELRAIEEAISNKRQEEVARIRNELENHKNHPSFNRISGVLEQGDLFTANEYMDMVRQKRPIPKPENNRDAFRDFFVKKYAGIEDVLVSTDRQAWKKSGLIGQIKKTGTIGPVEIPPRASKQAVDMLDTWFDVKGGKDIDPEDARKIMNYLGFNTANPIITKVGQYTWIEIATEPLQDKNSCPVPAYGSKAKGCYQIFCVWDRPNPETLLNAVKPDSQTSPVLVFYFGRITSGETRRELANLCRERDSKFIVIDDMLMLYLCGERGDRLPILFECALPFTFMEPYSTAAGLVPPEMFYGREGEKKSIIDPMGSCLIYGGRQLGKTVLLKYVERDFNAKNKAWKAKFIDIKEVGRKQPLDDIWELLAEKLENLGVIDAKQQNSAKTRNLELVKLWLDGDKQRRLLLLLDEADNFLEGDAKEDFPRCDRFRRLMQETNGRFKVVFAGLHNVQRTTRQANHPLAHFGSPICIGPLLNNGEMRAARALIERPLASLGYRFESPDLVARILSQTNYYPSLIQLYCKHLLERINNPDFATFDPKTSPPYIITSKQIDDAYNDRKLRTEIRNSFNLTLGLDKRYEVIAYAIAYGAFERKGIVDGFDVKWIQKQALYWWLKGFEGRSLDEIRALLEEMEGLGVLRVTSKGYFTLRNPNVTLLMGTKEEIEEELLREREVPLEYEPATFRSALSEGDPRRSPLTDRQKSDLQSRKNGVAIVFGSPAAGLDDVPEFLKAAVGDKLFVPIDSVSTSDEFSAALHQLNQREKNDTTLAVVFPTCPWNEKWVDRAIDKVKKLKSQTSFAQIVFIANPAQTWQWVGYNLKKPELRTFTLKPWSDAALRHWLDDCHFDSEPKVRKEIELGTGNWSFLLQEFYKLTNSEPSRRSEALENLERQLQTPEFVREVALSMGFYFSQPQRQQILKTLAELEEVSAEELALVENISLEIVNQTLQWADLLSLVTPVGEKDDRKNYWRIAPIVGRILQAMEN